MTKEKEKNKDDWKKRYEGYRDWRERKKTALTIAAIKNIDIRNDDECWIWLSDKWKGSL